MTKPGPMLPILAFLTPSGRMIWRTENLDEEEATHFFKLAHGNKSYRIVRVPGEAEVEDLRSGLETAIQFIDDLCWKAPEARLEPEEMKQALRAILSKYQAKPEPDGS